MRILANPRAETEVMYKGTGMNRGILEYMRSERPPWTADSGHWTLDTGQYRGLRLYYDLPPTGCRHPRFMPVS
jgi:hypothetical protein